MKRKWIAGLLNNRTPVLLLALFVALATSLSAAHIHEAETAGKASHFELAEDCALCHAGAAFTFDSGTPFEGSRLTHIHFGAGPVSTVQLGYSYIPESRPPPATS